MTKVSPPWWNMRVSNYQLFAPRYYPISQNKHFINHISCPSPRSLPRVGWFPQKLLREWGKKGERFDTSAYFGFGTQQVSRALHSQFSSYYTACQGKRECPVCSRRRSSAGRISEMNCKSSGPLPGSVLAIHWEGCPHNSFPEECRLHFFYLTSSDRTFFHLSF